MFEDYQFTENAFEQLKADMLEDENGRTKHIGMEAEDQLPSLSPDGESLLSAAGAITYGALIETSLAPGRSLTPGLWRKPWLDAVGRLLPRTVMCKQDWFLSEAFHVKPRRRTLLTMSRVPETIKIGPGMDGTFFSEWRERPPVMEADFVRMTRLSMDNVLGLLQAGGVYRTHLLEGPRLLGEVLRVMTLNGSAIDYRMCFRPELVVGDVCCRVITIQEQANERLWFEGYPISDEWLVRKLNIPSAKLPLAAALQGCNMIVNQYFRVGGARQCYDDIKGVRESNIGGKTVVEAHYNIIIWADDLCKIDKNCSMIRHRLDRIGAASQIEDLYTPFLFAAAIPGLSSELPFNMGFPAVDALAVKYILPPVRDRHL